MTVKEKVVYKADVKAVKEKIVQASQVNESAEDSGVSNAGSAPYRQRGHRHRDLRRQRQDRDRQQDELHSQAEQQRTSAAGRRHRDTPTCPFIRTARRT